MADRRTKPALVPVDLADRIERLRTELGLTSAAMLRLCATRGSIVLLQEISGAELSFSGLTASFEGWRVDGAKEVSVGVVPTTDARLAQIASMIADDPSFGPWVFVSGGRVPDTAILLLCLERGAACLEQYFGLGAGDDED